MVRITTIIHPVRPYDLDKTCTLSSPFPGSNSTDIYQSGEYIRTLRSADQTILVTVREAEAKNSTRIELNIDAQYISGKLVKDISLQVRSILGLDLSVSKFYRMSSKDPVLGPITKKFRGLRPTKAPTVFEALIQSIISQQIHTNVARKICNLLVENLGERLQVDGNTYPVFPTPESLANAGTAGLKRYKLSHRKAQYIWGIAQQITTGELDLESLRFASTDEAIQKLTALRGIGMWTANWLLIRALGHPDGFPSGDLALQKAVTMLSNNEQHMSERDILRHSKRWSPYRSLATTYIFAQYRSKLSGR